MFSSTDKNFSSVDKIVSSEDKLNLSAEDGQSVEQTLVCSGVRAVVTGLA